ncbi:MAG: DNA replication and repair protein RecF [Synergistaceae bacterium]|jgi:DNA replication and repair protein RecF|nr:DNA replication and repair protein RecF [Synergistaceae bacterium]
MEFSETAWKGFKNLRPRRQRWHPGFNVLLGPNGAGKTNLLESLSVLSGWGAFPSLGKTSSLVTWNADGAFLAAAAAGEREFTAEARVGARISLRAGNERVTHSELRALLPSLAFLPQDVGLLEGAASVRRRFLDRLCALVSPLYARRLAEYKQLVRQKTALLRQSRAGVGAALRALTSPMAQLGGWIRWSRAEAAAFFFNFFGALKDEPSGLLPFEAELSLEFRDYHEERTMKTLTLEGSAPSLPYLTGEFAAALEAGLGLELRAGMTLVGPHRDDLTFSCLGRPAALSLSRGQKRRMVMAAILAAGRVIEAKLRLKPILLLDDVAAELDAEGQERTGRALAASGWQVFSASASDGKNPFGEAANAVWRVEEGTIS